jgi:hypothetical protein
MIKVLVISVAVVAAVPCHGQEVRVFSGDIEHVYGPGARLLDDADLQARNQRASEHIQAERQLAIERRKAEAEIERLRLQEAALAYAPYSDTGGWWDGGWWDGGGFIGSTRGMFHRGVIRPRIGISQRIGSSPRMGGLRR